MLHAYVSKTNDTNILHEALPLAEVRPRLVLFRTIYLSTQITARAALVVRESGRQG